MVNSAFERNIKSWESVFYNHLKSQNELLEDRVHQRVSNNIEVTSIIPSNYHYQCRELKLYMT